MPGIVQWVSDNSKALGVGTLVTLGVVFILGYAYGCPLCGGCCKNKKCKDKGNQEEDRH